MDARRNLSGSLRPTSQKFCDAGAMRESAPRLFGPPGQNFLDPPLLFLVMLKISRQKSCSFCRETFFYLEKESQANLLAHAFFLSLKTSEMAPAVRNLLLVKSSLID